MAPGRSQAGLLAWGFPTQGYPDSDTGPQGNMDSDLVHEAKPQPGPGLVSLVPQPSRPSPSKGFGPTHLQYLWGACALRWAHRALPACSWIHPRLDTGDETPEPPTSIPTHRHWPPSTPQLYSHTLLLETAGNSLTQSQDSPWGRVSLSAPSGQLVLSTPAAEERGTH